MLVKSASHFSIHCEIPRLTRMMCVTSQSLAMIALILIKSNGQLQVLGKQSQSGPSKSLVLPREQAKSNSFREKRRRTEEKKANTAPEGIISVPISLPS